MTNRELAELLRQIKVETGSLMCLGCGYEHNCGVHGCNIMHMAADALGNSSRHVETLQKEIERLRAQLPRWIPVEERLPEDPVKKVLVFVPHTHGDIVDAGRYLGADGWVLEGWHLTQNAVTHWMPLPEPPEVENAETQ